MKINEKLAYIAGLMDGEGSWSIQIVEGRSPNPRMTMTLKYGPDEPLKLLCEMLGGSIYFYKDGMQRWSLGGTTSLRLATRQLLPYLKVKRDIAQNFLLALEKWPTLKGIDRRHGAKAWSPELLDEVSEMSKALNNHKEF